MTAPAPSAEAINRRILHAAARIRAAMPDVEYKASARAIKQRCAGRPDTELIELRLALAKHLATIGRVHPLWPNSKRPILNEWQKLATQEMAVIREWITRYPNCNWGITRNVADVDTKKPVALDTINALIVDHGEPDTLTVETASGGTHYYVTEELPNGSDTLGEGIDSRREGRGYVVAPGSHVVANGKDIRVTGFYKTTRHAAIASVPWLAAMKGDKPTYQERGDEIENPEPLISPELLAECLACLDPDDFPTNAEWEPLAMSCHWATAGQGFPEFYQWCYSKPYGGKDDVETRWTSFHVHTSGDRTVDSPGGLVDSLRKAGRDDLAAKVVGGELEADPITDADEARIDREALRAYREREQRQHSTGPGIGHNSKRELLSTTAAHVKPENLSFIWKERFARGTQVVLAGEGGKMKSQIMYKCFATITTGGKWPDGERAPKGWCVILSAEENKKTMIVPRLAAAGADLNLVEIIDAVQDESGGKHKFNLEQDLDPLRNKCRELAEREVNGKKYPVVMIGIDPASSYMGGDLDARHNTKVRHVLDPLSALADELNCVILSITHFRKGSGDKAVHKFMDSVAFVNAPRAGFGVFSDPDDVDGGMVFVIVKTNIGRGPGELPGFKYHCEYVASGLRDHRDGKEIKAPRIAWDGETHATADQIAQQEGERGSPKLDEAKAFLRRVLTDGPMQVQAVKEAAEAEGIAPDTLNRAKRDLHIDATTDGPGRPWQWSLPD